MEYSEIIPTTIDILKSIIYFKKWEQIGNKITTKQKPTTAIKLISIGYSVQAQESVSVAVLRSEASRIALSKSDDNNAEAHASICKLRIRL